MELKYFELANRLNKEYKNLLNDNEVHFRASINSISLISISNDKPEIGIKCSVSKYSNSAILKNVIEDDIKE